MITRNTRGPWDDVQCANTLWVRLRVCVCGYVCISAYPLLGAYYLTSYGYKRMRLSTRFYGITFEGRNGHNYHLEGEFHSEIV